MVQSKEFAKVGNWEMGNFPQPFPISRNIENGKWEVSPIGGLPVSHFSRRTNKTTRDQRALRAREGVRRVAA